MSCQPARAPAITQTAWLRLAEQRITAAPMRADGRASVTAVARAIARHAGWHDLRSRPTIARLTVTTGYAKRTVQRACRWLEHAGLLTVLERGTTPRYRARHEPGTGRLAREWQLTCGPLTVTPSPVPLRGYGDPPAPTRAREPRAPAARPREGAGQHREDQNLPFWPAGKAPARRRDALAAAITLTRDHLVLRRIPPRLARHVLRPWFTAGYTPADVLYAIEHPPGGTPHRHAHRVRSPAGWLRYRMSFWLGPAGRPVPPRSAELAAAAEAARAERYRAPASPGAEPTPEWRAAADAIRARARRAGTGQPARLGRPAPLRAVPERRDLAAVTRRAEPTPEWRAAADAIRAQARRAGTSQVRSCW